MTIFISNTLKSPKKLHSTQIDVWLYPLNIPKNTAFTILSPDEIERTNNYHFPEHQSRFCSARYILRNILSKYLHESPQSLCFTHSPEGKPELTNANIHFNLSHSKNWALLAIGTTPLGIDLEFFAARPYLGIAAKMFSLTEQQALKNLPKYIRPLGFFSLWSQKEAVIKAGGLGLSYPTNQISLPVFPKSLVSLFDPVHQTPWHVRAFMPHIACAAALCHHENITQVNYYLLDGLS